MVLQVSVGSTKIDEIVYKKERHLTLAQLCELSNLSVRFVRFMLVKYRQELLDEGLVTLNSLETAEIRRECESISPKSRNLVLFNKKAYLKLVSLCLSTKRRQHMLKYIESYTHTTLISDYFDVDPFLLSKPPPTVNLPVIYRPMTMDQMSKLIWCTWKIKVDKKTLYRMVRKEGFTREGVHLKTEFKYVNKAGKGKTVKLYTPDVLNKLIYRVWKLNVEKQDAKTRTRII